MQLPLRKATYQCNCHHHCASFPESFDGFHSIKTQYDNATQCDLVIDVALNFLLVDISRSGLFCSIDDLRQFNAVFSEIFNITEQQEKV